METKVNTEFTSFDITLDSMDEVKELLGILDSTRNTPVFINNLHHRLKEIAGVPMSGLYSGTISRSRVP